MSCTEFYSNWTRNEDDMANFFYALKYSMTSTLTNSTKLVIQKRDFAEILHAEFCPNRKKSNVGKLVFTPVNRVGFSVYRFFCFTKPTIV